jgi:quercetin dioxygenase-like cupin family protein
MDKVTLCDSGKTEGTILERLKKVNGCLDNVSLNLLSIAASIKSGSLVVNSGKLYNKEKDMEVTSVYEREDVSVLKAYFKKGAINNEHIHLGVLEYIICLNKEGKLELITPSGSRFCMYNELVVISASEPHKTIALEDTDVICVCVPKEKDYNSVLTIIKNEGI